MLRNTTLARARAHTHKRIHPHIAHIHHNCAMKQWAGRHEAKTNSLSHQRITSALRFLMCSIKYYISDRADECEAGIHSHTWFICTQKTNQQANHSATYGKSPVYFYKADSGKGGGGEGARLAFGLLLGIRSPDRPTPNEKRNAKNPPHPEATFSITCTGPHYHIFIF